MSDDLMQDESLGRAHRCVPPARRSKVGALWRCDCGSEYQYVDTRFGRQWQPFVRPAH